MAETQHEEDDQSLIITVILGFFLCIIAAYYQFVKSTTPKEKEKSESDKNSENEEKEKAPQPQSASNNKQHPKKKITNRDCGISHPFLIASLKGHTGTLLSLDFSNNGKYLASCSEDRTVRLWHVKNFTEKDHKYARVNVEFDHASSISFSPDSRAFIVSLATEQKLRVFKVHKEKKDGCASTISVSQEYDFPKIHKADIITAEISSNGKYIMSADKETQIIIWNLKGDILEKVDTLLVYNTSAGLSPCGNLIAACGFTSEVKLWYVHFTKNGEFQQVTKALEIKGHTAGVLSFSFSNDSKRLCTVSKDGSWKIWDIDVNYLKGQEAYLLHTGNYTGYEDGLLVHIALSHDHFTVAVSVGKNILYFNAKSHQLEESLIDVHQGDITALHWYSDSKMLISSGGVDRMIRVWHNPVGMKANLVDLKEKLPKASSDAMKQRIKQQIEEANVYLARFD